MYFINCRETVFCILISIFFERLLYTGWAIVGLPELLRTTYLKLKNNFGKKNKEYKNNISTKDKGSDDNNSEYHKGVRGSKYINEHKCNCTSIYLQLRSRVIKNIQELNSNDAMQRNGCPELRKIMDIELDILNNLQNSK